MKKIILVLLLGFFWTISDAQTIEKTFYFENPEIENIGQYQLINFENTMKTGLNGEPSLPYHAVKLMLPPGFSAESIEITGKNETSLNGRFDLYPKQAARPLSEGPSGEFIKNELLYNSNINYPQEKYGNLSTEYLNGYGIALSTFTPVNYNPLEGTINYFKEVTVRLKIKQDEIALKAIENITSTPKILDAVKAFIQNPEIMDQYPVRRSGSDDYQMMIITKETFENDFQDLIDIYLPRGIIAKVVTVEYIDNNISGQDLQEKIRNYIIREYQGHAVEYILLGGDVEHVPYRGFYCYVQSGSGYQDNNIPADLYYSGLDGTWNDDNDNKWGEIGEDDLLPDVSVARYSFSTLDELNKMIHKTTSYQDSPVTGELTHPLLVGEFAWGDPITWGADYLDLLIGYQNENGYETTGIPEDDDYETLYDRDATWSSYQLLNKINDGTSFIYHSGHSDWDYNMRLYNSDITNSNFSNVNGIDHNYTFVYSHGCNSGAFDQSDCIAEHMASIDNFLVAGALNSRYGWFNEGQTEGPSAHLNREFVDALYDKKKSRIGETHKISKIETSPWVNAPGQHEEGALRWCFYDCNIFGDPALGIWCAEPIDITVSYPDNVMIGNGSFNVTVISDDDPVEGLSCAFINGNDLYGACTTNENGEATINFDPANVSLGVANLVVSGYNCLPQYYEVTIIQGAAATQTISIDPGFQFVSSNISPESPDMLEVAADIINGDLHYIRNSSGAMLRKIGPNWVNGIGDWIGTEGYLIKTSAMGEFTVSGSIIPANTSILLFTGFQFVSYLPETEMDAIDAFASIISDDLNFVRNSTGGMLRKIGPNWVNGIGNCIPTEGYLIKMSADAELVYPGVAKSSGLTKVKPSHLIFEGGNAAEPVYTMYVDGLEIGDEVAAYNGNVILGSMTVTSDNAYNNALPVFSQLTNGQGYVAGEPISLKVWSNDNIVVADFRMESVYNSYVSDVYPSSDGEFSVVNVIKSALLSGELVVYPNPATDAINITSPLGISNVTIYNYVGQTVYSSNVNSSNVQINSNDFEAGIYIIRIQTCGGIETQRVAIK